MTNQKDWFQFLFFNIYIYIYIYIYILKIVASLVKVSNTFIGIVIYN